MNRDYAFLSHMMPDNLRDEVYLNSKGVMQDAADALQWHIYNGLCQNLQCSIKIFNILPISSFPQYYKKIFIKNQSFDTKYSTENINLGFCNIKVIREYSKYINIYKSLKEWLMKDESQKTLFLYTASSAFLRAIKKLKRKHDIEVCVIIADLPQMINLSSNKGFLVRHTEKIFSDMTNSLLSVADYYVLLTQYMADYLNLKKPYCVMEGICTSMQNYSIPKYASDIKTVFYAGTLHRKFGVINLLEAFHRIENPNYRLVICGVGDSEEAIKSAAAQDARILFYGKIPREKVLEMQTEATVLVNPRQNNEDFTRYSFPSKNLEYLSSGIPFIAYKLDGIPDEYDDYILYVENDSVSALSEKIVEVCEKSSKDREVIGQNAMRFVNAQKNEIIQTQKIISLIKHKCNG